MSSLELCVRAMERDDIDSVRMLAAKLRRAPHWSRSAWATLLDSASAPQRIALVALDTTTGALTGVVVAGVTSPEAELESIAVAEEFQRKGVARALFQAVEAKLRAAGVTAVLLEVRPSNLPAQRLYRMLGFVETGRRPSYYADPIEDALVLRLKLC